MSLLGFVVEYEIETHVTLEGSCIPHTIADSLATFCTPVEHTLLYGQTY